MNIEKPSVQSLLIEMRFQGQPISTGTGFLVETGKGAAVVTNPSILLADEPTGNLDSNTGDEIMNLFDQLQEAGNTLIVVTHEEYIADHARRTLRLSDGQVVGDTANGASR